jgi:hypothetical protein
MTVVTKTQCVWLLLRCAPLATLVGEYWKYATSDPAHRAGCAWDQLPHELIGNIRRDHARHRLHRLQTEGTALVSGTGPSVQKG